MVVTQGFQPLQVEGQGTRAANFRAPDVTHVGQSYEVGLNQDGVQGEHAGKAVVGGAGAADEVSRAAVADTGRCAEESHVQITARYARTGHHIASPHIAGHHIASDHVVCHGYHIAGVYITGH